MTLKGLLNRVRSVEIPQFWQIPEIPIAVEFQWKAFSQEQGSSSISTIGILLFLKFTAIGILGIFQIIVCPTAGLDKVCFEHIY